MYLLYVFLNSCFKFNREKNYGHSFYLLYSSLAYTLYIDSFGQWFRLKIVFIKYKKVPKVFKIFLRYYAFLYMDLGAQKTAPPKWSGFEFASVARFFSFPRLECLAKKRKNTLVSLVSLCEHRLSSLNKNIVVRVANHLFSHICITNLAFSCGCIFNDVIQVLNCML